MTGDQPPAARWVGLRTQPIIRGVRGAQPPLSLSTQMQVALVLPEATCQLPGTVPASIRRRLATSKRSDRRSTRCSSNSVSLSRSW